MSENKQNTNWWESIKEFGLSTLSVNNGRTVVVLTILIALMGFTSYIQMPNESFPELEIPTIYVGTPYPGNSPKVIEEQITRRLEKEISTIAGIDKLTSTSVQDYSTIIIEFDFDVSKDKALRKVKDAVDKARGDKDFPQDLPTEPNVFELDFAEMPILNINLSGNFSIDQLKEYGEYLEDEIEKLDEINKVEIRGIQEKEIQVAVNRDKAEAMEISFGNIEDAIKGENITMSGGELLVDGTRRSIRVEGEFTNVKEIEDIIVKREKGNLVYLRDIAAVTFGDKEAESFAREFTKPVVMLDVVKRKGKNLLDATDKIEELLVEAKDNYFPNNLEITITNDQSDSVREQVSNLENSIIFGIILVVFVLLYFLGLRNALFVGIAIPLSMMLSFILLNAMGITLNVIVLFSLVLALGMLVDNGIVVVENVYRLMDEGVPRLEAAKKGVGEVAIPIIASTATTLAAFLPLMFWPGIMGEFMQYLPLTLMIVLGSSLFVALVINPVLTSMYMEVEDKAPSKKKAIIWGGLLLVWGILMDLGSISTDIRLLMIIGNILAIAGLLRIVNAFILFPTAKIFQSTILVSLERGYEKFLGFALRGHNPKAFFGGAFGVFFLSVALLAVFTPKVEFFPINQPQYVNCFVTMPIGTDIQRTNEVTRKVETIVSETMKKYEVETTGKDGIKRVQNRMVESIIAQVGMGASDPNEGPQMQATPNKGRVAVSFVKFSERDGTQTSDLMMEIREALQGKFPADVQLVVAKNSDGPPQQPAINIECEGDNYEELVLYAQAMKSFIDRSGVEGIENLKMDIEVGKPELPIHIDREKARAFNLSTYQVAAQIRSALFGKEVSTFKQGDDDYEINIRYQNSDRYNLDNLMNQKITFRDAATGKINQVPVSALIYEPEKTTTYSAVKRKKQRRVITLFSDAVVGYNANEVVANIKDALDGFEFEAEGVTYRFTGQQEDMEKEMAFLSKALLIAFFLIFMILVSQFNSTLSPAVILIAVLLSLIGVFLGLVAFQMDFIIIMTMIGIISLAGIVVNNAIVLIDYTNLIMDRRKKELGLGEDDRLNIQEVAYCIAEGGKTRLRPVLLTAITTVLGLLPLAIGLNIDFVNLIAELDAHIFIGGDNVIFFGPMSWAIIFGLTFATFLTLIVVPVMYLILNKIKIRYNIK